MMIVVTMLRQCAHPLERTVFVLCGGRRQSLTCNFSGVVLRDGNATLSLAVWVVPQVPLGVATHPQGNGLEYNYVWEQLRVAVGGTQECARIGIDSVHEL